MEISRFLEKLASSTPTPGGGSASALVGALSASLVSMVAGLSSRKGAAKKKREMEEIKRKALAIQKRLFLAIDDDARSFNAVMKAFRLPENTQKERLATSKMVQRAYKLATVTPRLVCQCSLTLLEFCKILISEGNPNAKGDSGVAAYLAKGALESGILNVRVNLLAIHDRAFGRELERSVDRIVKRRDRLMYKISKLIDGIQF